MFKKLNTKILVVILVVLVAGIVIVFKMDEKKGSRTIKEELVHIDSTSVTSILLYPQADNHAEIKFLKNNKAWQVQKGKITVEADSNSVLNLLKTFKLIKPERLAATGKSQWKEYHVDDSLGTRIKFFFGDKLLADLVVGKFSFNNATRSGISYMRLFDDEDVYAVDGFIPMEVNQPFNQWRNKTLFKGDKNNFTKLTFNYPSDSGFVLMKENNKWKVDTAKADSNKVEEFLNGISFLSSVSFVDNYAATSSPEMSLTMEGRNMNPVLIKEFPADSIKKHIVSSSYNPSVYFSTGTDKMDARIFKPKSYFLPAIKAKENGINKK